jgi:arginase
MSGACNILCDAGKLFMAFRNSFMVICTGNAVHRNVIAALPISIAALPNAIVAYPNAIVACPNAIAALPNAIVAYPNAIVACPNVIAACPNVIAACPNAIAACPNAVAACPNVIAACPNAIGVRPISIGACPNSVVACPNSPRESPHSLAKALFYKYPVVTQPYNDLQQGDSSDELFDGHNTGTNRHSGRRFDMVRRFPNMHRTRLTYGLD